MYHRVAGIAAAIAIAATLPAGVAAAHTTGTSTGELALGAAGHLEATFVFARGDAEVLAPGGEVDLRALAEHGVDVRADGAPCPGAFESASVVGGDGVEVHMRFACAEAPRTLDVSLPFLDGLPASHIDLMHVAAAGRSALEPIRSSRQHVALVLAPEGPSTRVRFALAIALAVVLAGALVAAFRHSLRSRRSWHNRPPHGRT